MNSSVFTMFPMAQTVELTPGEIYRGSINIVNPEDAKNEFQYTAVVTPYSVVDNDYEADLSTASDASMIADWLTIDEPTGTVKPGETKELKFRVKTPGDAPSGGQYATIAVRVQADNNESPTVNNVIEMASVIYAEVDGEIIHDGELISNIVPGFATMTPVKTVVKFRNDGNVHEPALITLTVKNAWTGEVVFPLEDEVNEFTEVVMPGTVRTAPRNIERLASLGAYEVTQTVEYMGETSEVTQVVMICPIWFMLLILATIVSAIWTLILFARKRKYQEQVF